MKTTTVIFDLDGTLLDTLEDLKNAVNRVLSEEGLPQYSRAEVQRMVGNGIGLLIRRAVGEGRAEEYYAALLQRFIIHYKAHLYDASLPYEGITELLRDLKKKGYKTALVSNKWDEAVQTLRSVFFDGLLDEATGELKDVARKPDPALPEMIIRRLGVTKEECLYVGDSGVDVETAKNTGLRFVAVTWGFRTREELSSYGARTFIDRPEELWRYVGG